MAKTAQLDDFDEQLYKVPIVIIIYLTVGHGWYR
jgi:hypothetical protein